MTLVHETKKFLSSHFEMKSFGDVSFVLRIQIQSLSFKRCAWVNIENVPSGTTCKIVHLVTHLWLKVIKLTCTNALKLIMR